MVDLANPDQALLMEENIRRAEVKAVADMKLNSKYIFIRGSTLSASSVRFLAYFSAAFFGAFLYRMPLWWNSCVN